MTHTYGPYSATQRAGDIVYTAGQIGAVKGKAAPDITAQTKQVLKNLKAVLEDAGSGLEHVVKTTVFLTNMAHFEQMNKVYSTVFSEAGCSPARSCVGVVELPRVADRPLLIEVEAVALARKETQQ